MNILVDQLPTTLEIGGRKYEIRSDFRDCLKIILAFEDPELASIEKQTILLSNLYKEMPDNIHEAFERGMWFLNGGEESASGDNMRLYSFDKDANYIMAAFRQTHGIDLETAEMHWWKFMAYFMDLGSETTFNQLIGLRKRVKTGKASKEERQAALEIKEIFDLPELDNRTLEEREAENAFMKRYKQGRQKCQQDMTAQSE